MKKSYQVLLNDLVAVNAKDQFLHSIPKWDAHLNSYITQPQSVPHRAFSIFLFNSENKMLFQRRSIEKKTFPLCWTNTCCSHPNMILYQGEKQPSVEPIRDSLHRALWRQFRMTIPNTCSPFYLLDKIMYKAQGRAGEQFGEFQVDYIFVAKLKEKDVAYEIVQQQIKEVEWVSRNEIDSFIEEKQKEGCLFSPWFMIMYRGGLFQKWWDAVIKGEARDAGKDDEIPVKCM